MVMMGKEACKGSAQDNLERLSGEIENNLARLSEIGIIPVIKLEQTELAVPLAGALNRGGLPAAEITFRAKGADRVIGAMLEAYPDMLAGAGTVISLDQARAAAGAGARFLVSPGFDREIAEYCAEQEIAFLPGCVTPTEIQQAMKYGLGTLKFFPAEQFGGLRTIKALGGPYPDLRFMPTGGISMDNLGRYIGQKNVAACGGSFIATEAYIQAGDWDSISELCRQATAIVRAERGR